MAVDKSRRGFLKATAAVVAAGAVAAAPLPQAVAGAGGEKLATLLDLSKCIGCGACVEACREKWQNTIPVPQGKIPQPIPSRVPTPDWSNRKDRDDRLTPYNFLFVEQLVVKHDGKEREINVPRRCMHCDNPPCTNLCPFGAGRVEKNGVVRIDEDVCLGGAKCKQVCPWSVPQRQSGVGIYLDILPTMAGNGVMFKCHRCWPLVKEGKTPRCIEVCPEKVQKIGPKDQIVAEAKTLAKKMNGYIYGLTENGGTNTIYVSPVPFESIDKAIAEGRDQQKERAKQGLSKKIAAATAAGKTDMVQKLKVRLGQMMKSDMGRPHMGAVGNSMGSEEKMTAALLLAPVAGIAAGFTRLFGKKMGQDAGRKEDTNG